MASPTPRPLPAADLHALVVDTAELAKGARLFDEQALVHLARHGSKLFCEAKGSGPAPYRVSLSFSEASPEVYPRCTCMAALSRPFCKHAAGLLVAWARAPEAFAIGEGPPPRATAGKRAVKKGATQVKELMRSGVARVDTLVRELGVSGVASVGADRVPQIRELGDHLRESKLRRLSARTLDLAVLLEAALARRLPVPAVPYADLVTDLRLTARKLEKHLGGEPLDDRHVEELVGKTWRDSECARVEGLSLVEYAYGSRVTSDDYLIRESRFVDVGSGVHYAEKQILPRMLARSSEPKPSRAGHELSGARAGVYPGYPPFRLRVTDLGEPRPIGATALAALRDRALPDLPAALAALQEHRRDLFAPELLPVAVRVSMLLARGGRLQAVDAQGNALHLPGDPDLDDRLGGALRDARLVVVLGDLGVEAALPTLHPLALLVETGLGLELRALGRPASDQAHRDTEAPASWVAVAREAGVSPAAVALGEVREELADAFVVGLAGLGERVAGPLAARLAELGLAKQAALLTALAASADPAARLDDFIKLYQVLGIALARLAGATPVDLAALESAPGYESVRVLRPTVALDPAEVGRRRASGTLGRFDAALHLARHHQGRSVAELVAAPFSGWADASAAPFLARAFLALPAQGVGLTRAERVLASSAGRTAKATAIQVLQALAAQGPLRALAAEERADPTLRAMATDALDALALAQAEGTGDAVAAQAVRARREATNAAVGSLAVELVSDSYKESRLAAAVALGATGCREAVPFLRQALLGDPAKDVREQAALALGRLGDVDMLDRFVRTLAARGSPAGAEARAAATALGHLADTRALEALLAACDDGYKPAIEALRGFGVALLEPLLGLLPERRDLLLRRPVAAALDVLSDDELAEGVVRWIAGHPALAALAEVTPSLLKLAGPGPGRLHPVGRALAARFEGALGKAELAALGAARKALGSKGGLVATPGSS